MCLCLRHILNINTSSRCTIRGRSDDDAVLCTGDKTYTVRSVVLSNAVCVLTPPSCDETGDAIIREKIHEILELHPTIPKLHRLNGILRGHEYDDTDMDTDPVSHRAVFHVLSLRFILPLASSAYPRFYSLANAM